VGHGIMPEYFMVLPPEGGLFSQADYGVLFTSLGTAQTLGGFGGMVNDLVVDLAPGTSTAEAAAAVEAAFAAEHPDLGVTVTTGDEDPARRLLYDDLAGDRQMMRVFALLIFAGAVAAAFNLTSRMVEATRREIGIGMALGVRRGRIALRPLLVGAQIALLGTVFGIGAGLLVNRAMKGVLQGFLPLPEWRTPFLARHFAGGAAIGLVSTLVAVALPVWRALRVRPVEAIRTGHLAARGAGLSRALRRLPGDSLAKMPFRNLLRAPRRTILTALGIGAAVTVLVTMVVMVGSFLATVDAGAAEVTRGAPDRMIAGLDTVRPIASPGVQAVLGARSVGRAEPGLRLPAQVSAGAGELDLMLEVDDLTSTLWHPTLLEGEGSTTGLVLSEKAAADLEVAVGDEVTLLHPRRLGLASVDLEESVITVGGIHRHPFRFVAYLDDSQVGLLGMEGLTNTIDLEPAPGMALGDVQRELIGVPAVASVQRADGVATTIRDFLSQFLGIFQIAEAIAVALMLLIAFNSAGVAADERAREHATMLAFGVRRRRILGASMVESAALGVVATLLGALGGTAFLRWIVRPDMEATVPDILLRFTVTPGTVGLVALLGIAAVAVAPVLTFRKLRRLDIPSTLRVME
jgi:putative ABC transport system permease protein